MATSLPPARPLPPAAAQTSSSTRTAAVMFAGFCAFLTLYAPQPLLPMLARGFHASAGVVSLVLTASTAAVALAAPFAGVVADRFGRKRVIVLSALLLALPTAGAAASGSLPQMLVWRFWQGVFTPGIFAVTIAYVNDEWEQGGDVALAAGGPPFFALPAWGFRAACHARPSSQPAAGGHLRRRLLRSVHPHRHLHLREFLFGRAALPLGHHRAGADLRGLPDRRRGDAGGRPRHRPYRASLHPGRRFPRRCGRHLSHPGAASPRRAAGSGADFDRRLLRPIRRFQLCR